VLKSSGAVNRGNDGALEGGNDRASEVLNSS